VIFVNTKFKCITSGFLAGVLNSLFGAGGGIVIAQIFIFLGLTRREAHACAICTILPICILSTFLYLRNNFVNIFDVNYLSIYGVIGAIFGCTILKNINTNILRKIFGFFSIFVALRLILR
jgi:uncharacterized membrane protein YfcA